MAADDGGLVRYRMVVSAGGWQKGMQPPRQPLLDIPRRYVGEAPDIVKDLYRARLRKDDDGRLAAGHIYLKFDAAEMGSAGEPVKGQLSVVPKGLWPRIIMDMVTVAQSRYSGTFDPVLQLNRQRKLAVPPNADFIFYTDPKAQDFVWIQCRYENETRIGIDDPGRCSMDLMPADYVAVSIGFDSRELPLWRQRADRLRTLVPGWVRPESEWPPVVAD